MSARSREFDQMRRVLRDAGYERTDRGVWFRSEAQRVKDDARLIEHYQKGHAAGRTEVADLVLNAFGLAENYPSSTETVPSLRYAPTYLYGFGGGYESYDKEIVTAGSVGFLADLEAVAASVTARGAKRRLGIKKRPDSEPKP